MYIFQYWDNPSLPIDVAEWTAGIARDNPDFDYRLLSEADASRFIETHYDTDKQLAFAACAVPAMQADYIRLCLLDICGGLYIDADHISQKPLIGMIEKADVLLPCWMQSISNGIMLSRRAANPFIRECLRLATENITMRRFNNALIATGPGLFTAMRHVIEPESRPIIDFAVDHSDWPAKGWHELLAQVQLSIRLTAELVSAWHRITLFPVENKSEWLADPNPAYKNGPRHWQNWSGSIYR